MSNTLCDVRCVREIDALCTYVKMQVEYPNNVHLIRGNHEAADINALFGFRIECIERMVLYLSI